jgi:hypothetical protein
VRMLLVSTAVVSGVAKEMSLIQQHVSVDIADNEGDYDYDGADAGKGGKSGKGKENAAGPTGAGDSDSCLQKSPYWPPDATCASSTHQCNFTLKRDMQRCCPNACGVTPLCTLEECYARFPDGGGQCNMYPNDYSEQNCPGPTPAPTPAPTRAPTPAPTPRPTRAPSARNSDSCLQKTPYWLPDATCASSTHQCNGALQRDMQRCCPKTCGVTPLCTLDECYARFPTGQGQCSMYPNDYSEQNCPGPTPAPTPAPTRAPTPAPTPRPTREPRARDSDSCLQKTPYWRPDSTCASNVFQCTFVYERDMHRCCPKTCGVTPLCTQDECYARFPTGNGLCSMYPSDYTEKYC